MSPVVLFRWLKCPVWFVGNFHTGANFIEKSESGAMVRFVRVTYVRRGLDDSSDTPSTAAVASVPDYSPPKGFSYKTFVPSPVKVAMCSGAPVYESFASTWERARVWLRLVGQRSFCWLAIAQWSFIRWFIRILRYNEQLVTCSYG